MVRAGLTRDVVLQAAVEVADREGLAALSMRRLAAEVGVEAMSLYNHVADKQDLHTGMVGIVWAEVDPAADEPRWRPALQRLCRSAYGAFLRHPWFFELSLPANGGSERLAVIEATLAYLDRGGVHPDVAFHALHVIDGFVYGYSWQANEFSADASWAPDEVELEKLFAGRPHLAAHAQQHSDDTARGDGFVIGLDLILDGLERAANDHLDT